MREIKFRAWNTNTERLIEWDEILDEWKQLTWVFASDKMVLMQYTGLKDKNGVAEIYECDILDEYGNIKGNIYQMDKGETDTVIQGFGTKDWCETYRRAILLGCKDSE